MWYIAREVTIVEEKSLSTQVYERIKEDIISLKYPPGSVLKERELSETLGVSRTPIREAIQRLSQEFWLVPGEGKRMQVRPVTIADVHEIIQIRNLVEYAAIDVLLENGEARVIAGRLDSILNEMKVASDEYTFTTLDLKFHHTLVESMNNYRLLRFWGTVQEEILRIGLLVIRGTDRWQEAIKEHECFVDALWNRDSAKIHGAMRDHLEHSYAVLISDLEKRVEEIQ